MSSVATLDVRKRPFSKTKGELSELRKAGFVPAVLYGDKKEPEGFSVCRKGFLKELEKPGIQVRVFDLGEKVQALVKDIQFDPVTDLPIHIDFYRLRKGARVTVQIPIHFINHEKAPGIKKGGVLNTILHTLEMSVPSSDIPEELIVDLTGLDIGSAVHISNLALPKDAKLLHHHDEDAVATIVTSSGLASAESGESGEQPVSDEATGESSDESSDSKAESTES